MFAPANSHSNEDVLPRAEKWGSEYTGAGDHKGDLRTFRLLLDSAMGDRVSFFNIDSFYVLLLSCILETDQPFSLAVEVECLAQVEEGLSG